jgi:pilus assembly protein Flp/PilA
MLQVTIHQRINVAKLPCARGRRTKHDGDDGMKNDGMKNKVWLLKRLLSDDSGQDLIEYALVAALLALSAVAAMGTLSNKISNEFNKVGDSL